MVSFTVSRDPRRVPGMAALAGAVALVLSVVAGCVDSGGGTTAGDDGAAVAVALAPAAGEAGLPEATSSLGSYLAVRHARRNNDSAAVLHFIVRVLEEDPANPDLLNRALMAALAERDMGAAEGYAERLLAVDDEAAMAGMALAVAALGRGERAAALAHLDAMLPAGLNRYLVPLLRAWAMVGGDDGDPLEALAPLSDSSAFASTHDFHKGLIGEILGRPRIAENGYAGALSSQRGGSLRVVLAAGGFYHRTGRVDEARAIYDAFLDENPDTTFLDEVYRRLDGGDPPALLITDGAGGIAEVFYGIAASLSQENALEPALIYAQMALHLQPGMAAALMLLGDILAAVERYEDAVRAYTGDTDSPALGWALRLRTATALAQLERIDEAAEQLRMMARERPERSGPLVTLGDMLRSRKRWRDAVEAYDQALARIPTLEQRHWTLLYARGISLERSEQWPRAEADFLQALDLEPDQPLVLNYLGYSWVEKGLYLDRARAMIQTAVDQRPNDGYIVDSLGWVLYQLGDFAGAAHHLERAAELRPGDPVILDHYGDGLWRIGRRQEARFQWRRALSFEPEPEAAETIRLKLENGLVSEPAEALKDL